MQEIPCGHLIAADPAADDKSCCNLGRRFPDDCTGCASYTPGITNEERTRCEVWTRVMGYHRPVSAFNKGKQAEHRERRKFVLREHELGAE